MFLVDDETQTRQRMISVFPYGQLDIGGQTRRLYRFERAIAQIRECIEHGGNEHVAGNAADCVQVNVHVIE